MARRKNGKNKSKMILIVIMVIVIVLFGVLVVNSLMNGELLKSMKIFDEKTAELKKEEIIDSTTDSDVEKDDKDAEKNKDKDKGKDKTEETKKEDVFVKKEDDTSFKVVDKTVDDTEIVQKPYTEERKQQKEDDEALAVKVVEQEWFGGEKPADSKYYFNVSNRESDNIIVVEVRDKETTRILSRYRVNVQKKEIEKEI